MIGLILASIWLLFMTISPGLCFSFQALTRQTRPGLLSNLHCPSLLRPLMNRCREGEIRKLIRKICPGALKYFGVNWSSWWHVPTHHTPDLMLTHLPFSQFTAPRFWSRNYCHVRIRTFLTLFETRYICQIFWIDTVIFEHLAFSFHCYKSGTAETSWSQCLSTFFAEKVKKAINVLIFVAKGR